MNRGAVFPAHEHSSAGHPAFRTSSREALGSLPGPNPGRAKSTSMVKVALLLLELLRLLGCFDGYGIVVWYVGQYIRGALSGRR